jgi:hypothetical protein
MICWRLIEQWVVTLNRSLIGWFDSSVGDGFDPCGGVPMKSILVFAAAEEHTRRFLAPYKLSGFLSSLREEDIDSLALDVSGREPGPSAALSLLRLDPPRVVHTFGDVALLSTIWRDAAQAGCLVVHSVTGDCAPSATNFRRVFLRTALGTRYASRHVQGVLGSSRVSICNYIEAGFFWQAKFSMIALPPVEIPMETETAVRTHTGPLPTFGYYNHYGANRALNFLLAAVKLTGVQHLFRLVIGEGRDGSPSSSRQFENVVFERFDTASDFVDSVDVLIAPESDDRAIEQVVLARRDHKTVIAPDGGAIAEFLRFGRNGVLFSAGNPYDLARSINNVTASGMRQPFNFKGGDSIIHLAAPREVARIFARAYRKLENTSPAISKIVA